MRAETSGGRMTGAKPTPQQRTEGRVLAPASGALRMSAMSKFRWYTTLYAGSVSLLGAGPALVAALVAGLWLPTGAFLAEVVSCMGPAERRRVSSRRADVLRASNKGLVCPGVPRS